ncbi:MAG: hypothetical protein JOZ55_09355 [Alphaproteobacteria bacterium]|nr:hypothetical protein [Alphaproteobacteria bacterium]
MAYPQAAAKQLHPQPSASATAGTRTIVAFLVPPRFVRNTNLASDSRLSLETRFAPNICSASIFLDDPQSQGSAWQNGIRWSTASGTDAGAGNLYEEKVFATRIGGRCLAIRYFIHSMNLGNYPPNAVRAFNRADLMSAFDAMRASLAPLNSRRACHDLHASGG